MKKIRTIGLVVCAMLAIALTANVFAGSFGVISLPSPGTWEPVGIDVGKFAQIEVRNSAVAAGTVIIKSVSSDNTVTQTLYTVTCSGGAVTTALATTNTQYYVAGEKLIRAGTATNGTCRIIVTN